MKRLRRKRSSDNTKAPLPISVPQPIAAQAGADTPLYAKFATAHRSQHGSKPIVSGPMALTSKQSFHSTTSPTRERRTSESRSRTLSTRQEEPPKRLSASPPKPPTRQTKEPAVSYVPSVQPTGSTSYSQDETRNENSVPSSLNPHLRANTTSQSAPPKGSADDSVFPQSSLSPSQPVRQASQPSRLPVTRDVHVPDELPITPQKTKPSALHHRSAMAVGTGGDDQDYDPFRTSIFAPQTGQTPTKNNFDTPPVPSRAISMTDGKLSGHFTGPHPEPSMDIPPPLPSKALPLPPTSSPRPPPVLKPSLTAPPSSSRKKYSPLAAFGLGQGHKSHSAPTPPNQTQTEQVRISIALVGFAYYLHSFFSNCMRTAIRKIIPTPTAKSL